MFPKTIIICCCAVLMIFFCSCTQEKSLSSNNETTTENLALWEEGTGSNPLSNDSNQVTDSIQIKKENICKKNEAVSYGNFLFSNVKFNMSKVLLNEINKNDVAYFEAKHDENGNLTENDSYAFVTMDITNKSTEQQEMQLYFSTFLLLDENYVSTSKRFEARYRSGTPIDDGSNYYKQIFSAGETVTITIAYILEDSILSSNNLYFSATPEKLNENSKVIKVN